MTGARTLAQLAFGSLPPREGVFVAVPESRLSRPWAVSRQSSWGSIVCGETAQRASLDRTRLWMVKPPGRKRSVIPGGSVQSAVANFRTREEVVGEEVENATGLIKRSGPAH